MLAFEAMRVLLVEDQPTVAAFVTKGLREEGFAVDTAATLRDGTHLATHEAYDLVIADRRLPDGEGLELVKALRGCGHGTPVLVLSALSDTASRVSGLDAGADDYLTKPFAFSELLARARALLRRGRTTLPTVLRIGDVELDPASRKATANGKKLVLTAREFALLQLFLRSPEVTLSRTAIGESVWDYHSEASSNVIDVYIRRLRKKLEEAGSQVRIETLRGAGYSLGLGPGGSGA